MLPDTLHLEVEEARQAQGCDRQWQFATHRTPDMASMCVAMAPPTSMRENRSMKAAIYSQPVAVRM